MVKPKTEIERVVAYARVSAPKQAEKDLSIPAQLDALRSYALQRGQTIIREYVEPGVSGREDDRPEFQKMMQDILAPSSQIDALLTYSTSRFMRNVQLAQAWKAALRKKGVRFIAISQETADDPNGELMSVIYEAFDQYESQVNGVRTRAAMRENAKRGFFNGSCAPFGFEVKREEIKPGLAKGRLIQNASEAALGKEIFRLYVAGAGAMGVARSLNQRGHRFRRGALWRKDHVLKILRNPVAIGTHYWGQRDARSGNQNDPSEWVPMSVEPFLDKDLWDMAQCVLQERDPERFPGGALSSPLLLANIVKCGKCGATYQLETSGRVKPGAPYYRYYNCRTTVRAGKEGCDGFRIPVDLFEREILEHLAERLFTPEACRALLHDLIEETGILRQKTAEQRKGLQSELDDCERRLRKWEHAFEAGEMSPELGAERVRELKGRRDELKQALAKIVPLRPPPAYLYSDQNIERFRQSIRSIFLSGQTSLTRSYLRFLVDRITVNGTEIAIQGRSESALKLMAEPSVAPEEKHLGGLQAAVQGWLPGQDSNLRHGG